MTIERPPTLDPVAAQRWWRHAPAQSPWLHEEVGRRMQERLEWIRLSPQSWADWRPVQGGLHAHALVAERYPHARQQCVEDRPAHVAVLRSALAPSLWQRIKGAGPYVVSKPEEGSVQMLWANMLLHTSDEPSRLIEQWHRALAVDGFLMFSCLGPDSLRELRGLYARLGWSPPAHEFTDMHDWGDMLVATGFAEPVMDMERITLTFDTPARLIQELRELGANLSVHRHRGLRGRQWRATLESAVDASLRDQDGRLALTFEVIYGHAVKPAPRLKVASESALSMQEMRQMLRSGRRGGAA